MRLLFYQTREATRQASVQQQARRSDTAEPAFWKRKDCSPAVPCRLHRCVMLTVKSGYPHVACDARPHATCPKTKPVSVWVQGGIPHTCAGMPSSFATEFFDVRHMMPPREGCSMRMSASCACRHPACTGRWIVRSHTRLSHHGSICTAARPPSAHKPPAQATAVFRSSDQGSETDGWPQIAGKAAPESETAQRTRLSRTVAPQHIRAGIDPTSRLTSVT